MRLLGVGSIAAVGAASLPNEATAQPAQLDLSLREGITHKARVRQLRSHGLVRKAERALARLGYSPEPAKDVVLPLDDNSDVTWLFYEPKDEEAARTDTAIIAVKGSQQTPEKVCAVQASGDPRRMKERGHLTFTAVDIDEETTFSDSDEAKALGPDAYFACMWDCLGANCPAGSNALDYLAWALPSLASWQYAAR